MLHSRVYNTGLTPELKRAVIERDVDFIRAQANLNAQRLLNASPETYERIASDLFICLGLIDSLETSGITLQFMCDMINF